MVKERGRIALNISSRSFVSSFCGSLDNPQVIRAEHYELMIDNSDFSDRRTLLPESAEYR